MSREQDWYCCQRCRFRESAPPARCRLPDQSEIESAVTSKTKCSRIPLSISPHPLAVSTSPTRRWSRFPFSPTGALRLFPLIAGAHLLDINGADLVLRAKTLLVLFLARHIIHHPLGKVKGCPKNTGFNLFRHFGVEANFATGGKTIALGRRSRFLFCPHPQDGS